MPDHDPLKFVTGLSARLASRSRHVCVFLGAGVAKASGLPDLTELQAKVLATLGENERDAFQKVLTNGNLETGLTRLRRISALLTDSQTFEGFSKRAAQDLDQAVCAAIIDALNVATADLRAVSSFAAWAARADYMAPLEVFTVNYDLLLETAFELLRIPYFDGFVGSLKARFHTELVESMPSRVADSVPAFFVRLWKLHGSVNWAWDGKDIVRLGVPSPQGAAAAIYPSDAKYEESRRVPFVVLQDRFRRALQEPETLVLVSGYSFKDFHINELLFNAATQRERSEIVAFCRSSIPNDLAERATITPNLQVVSASEAILGGVRGKWAPATQPASHLWAEDRFALREFGNLAAYLARSAATTAVDDIAKSDG
jgi:hypothetical protein